MNQNKPNQQHILQSQSRINRINELYKNKTASKTQDSKVNASKQSAVKNPFVSTPVSNDEPYESSESDMDELQYTPKLKSRYNVRTNNASPSPTEKDSLLFKVKATSKPRVRKTSSTKVILGDPLPLPYDTHRITNNKGDVTTVDGKRKLMESKWRNLMVNSKENVRSKFNEQRSFSEGGKKPKENQRISSVRFMPVANEHTTLLELKNKLIANGHKLDSIIQALNSQEKKQHLEHTKNIKPSKYDYKEIVNSLLWAICIIILTICNLYVYKYL
ncbi:hypothetical protein TPHA_0O01660 [Tetrapisispora phaffii CBS 4417]|uniref:Uncharacterized protein n=1 Tax=Tetrapisispora phaffii (strain ATCC 24235 / CBS 4417 / NBRC 1672 / NRRL Y-8282 / UCD 70-5) TaxID=1071381 RepID=G8C1V5_TETPH|nr:hypothetical protein TPHA_0O01660 [Tetrapisispora phaffii CBS 4417]CCE66133.1 hypothetical protein TPHA_0O01660 [Tetrapisispora phaffii CBS 4417]